MKCRAVGKLFVRLIGFFHMCNVYHFKIEERSRKVFLEINLGQVVICSYGNMVFANLDHLCQYYTKFYSMLGTV